MLRRWLDSPLQRGTLLAVCVACFAAGWFCGVAQAGDRLVLGPRVVHHKVTSYCLLGGMRYGRYVYHGAVASNTLPAKALIRMERRIRIPGQRARRYFRVEDTGAAGLGLDLWSPSCSWSRDWGVRTRTYRRVVRRLR
jgi:hypothetical protein